MFAWLLVPVEEALDRVGLAAARDRYEALRARGYRPVTGTISRWTSPGERPDITAAWLASPDGTHFADVGGYEGDLSSDLVTCLDNGARIVTVLVTSTVEDLVDSLETWPEGGAYYRHVRDPDLAAQIAGHEAEVAAAVAREGARPIPHVTADDVVLTKRIGARLSDNFGWSRSLGRFQTPPPARETEQERIFREVTNDRMTARDQRIHGLVTTRVPVAELRGWPTVPTGLEGAHGRWRNWTDDEQEEVARRHEQAQAGHLSDEDQRPLILGMLAKQAEAAGLDPTPEALDRAVDATLAVSKAVQAGQAPTADVVRELREALAALRG